MSLLPRIAEYPAFLAGWGERAKADRAAGAPRVVSLFAGCGGSSTGYRMAGFDVALATDSWNRAAESYLSNWPSTPFWVRDVADVESSEMLHALGMRPGDLDLLDGSPPCQGFSVAGKRRFGDGRNGLFRHFVHLLEGLRPRTFVMENVTGLVRGKMRIAFRDMTSALKEAGYGVSCRALDASWFGVPQERRRLIWVGVRSDLPAAPSHPPPAWAQVSVREALADLAPGIAAFRCLYERKAWTAVLRNDMDSNEWKSADKPSVTVTANRPPVVKETRSPAVLAAWESSARYVGSFHSVRLREDVPSPVQIGACRHWHPTEARQMTDRECARLQSFPDWYRFIGNKSEVTRQIGNSVPPLMMAHVAAHVGRTVPDFRRDGGGN